MMALPPDKSHDGSRVLALVATELILALRLLSWSVAWKKFTRRERPMFLKVIIAVMVLLGIDLVYSIFRFIL